ncbi:MAG TPA: hypothetical protein VFA20_05525 [Myxococcaceae bacterium]|nr:hypothetical protein [Myxococcaceae bacterium]
MALVGAGCATAPPPAPVKKVEAAPPANATGKKEVVVIGKKQPPIPGLRPTDQDTEFTIFHGTPMRCTKVKGSPEHPRGQESCRALNSGQGWGTGGGPDTGLIDRGSQKLRQDP